MLRLGTSYIEIVGGSGARMYVKTSGKPVFDSDGDSVAIEAPDVTAIMRAHQEHERPP